MNHSTAIFLVNPDAARAVRCAYELDADGKPSKLYTFKTVLRDLVVGDIVVVPTETRVGFTCVQVAELDVEPDLDSGIQYKWIVAKVDREEYNRICAAEGEMISKIKRAEVRKKREDLANSLFKDQEALKAELQSTVALALPGASSDDQAEAPRKPQKN